MNQLENKLANFVKQVTINRALKKIDLCWSTRGEYQITLIKGISISTR
jgi:hypothetical protein